LNSGDITLSYPSSNACTGSLVQGEVCTFQVSFTPAAAGPLSASLLIQSNAANSPQVIALTGQGLARSGAPPTLSSPSLTFTQAGVPQNIIVTNNGSSPVSIGNIVNNNSFVFAQTNNCGTMLAAQSICTISVQANELNVGASSGQLTVINSSTSGALTVQLNVPVSPVVFFTNPVMFGDLALGVTSEQLVQISAGSYYNNLPQVDGSITGPNAGDFALLPSFPGAAPTNGGCNPVGGSFSACEFAIAFTPSAIGARTATLTTNFGNVALSGNGTPAGPSFTIPAYLMTYANVGSSMSTTLTVLDNGSTQITLSQFSVTGANASDFAVTNQCSTPINPLMSCNLGVVFTPAAVGLRTATLTLTDASSGVSRSISLSGQGNPMVPALSPGALTFGNTQVGSVSAQQIVTVNQQNGDPVTVQAAHGSTSEFVVVPSGTCATQTPCQITVSFQPTATGLQSAGFSVTDVLGNASTTLGLQGSGGVATLSLSTTSLTFAARDQGTTSISQAITLTNTGNTDLFISGITLNGANTGDFPIESNTCGNDVAAGASCTVSISFSPTASGLRNANLVIQSNAASSPDMVQLSGTGN